MGLISLSLAAGAQLLIPPQSCEAQALLRERAVEIVKLAQVDRGAEFNRLVSSDVSVQVWMGDQGFGVRNDERALRALGDARQQTMRLLKSWNLNRYTVRSAGIGCGLTETIGLEFRSDAKDISIFLTFNFNGGQLAQLEGEGYFASDFEIGS
jgi:hypothetical protein